MTRILLLLFALFSSFSSCRDLYEDMEEKCRLQCSKRKCVDRWGIGSTHSSCVCSGPISCKDLKEPIDGG